MSVRHKILVPAIATVLALAGMFAGIVAADSQIASVTLAAGTLSETLHAITIPGASLTGSDQTDAFTVNWTPNDATGSGTGWNVTVSQTPFSNGAPTPKYLETDNLNNGAQNTGVITLGSATAACTALSTCTLATNSAPASVVIPAGTFVGNTYTAPTSAKFYDAAANTGMGSEDIASSSSLFISGATFAGTYTSTMTVAITAGP